MRMTSVSSEVDRAGRVTTFVSVGQRPGESCPVLSTVLEEAQGPEAEAGGSRGRRPTNFDCTQLHPSLRSSLFKSRPASTHLHLPRRRGYSCVLGRIFVKALSGLGSIKPILQCSRDKEQCCRIHFQGMVEMLVSILSVQRYYHHTYIRYSTCFMSNLLRTLDGVNGPESIHSLHVGSNAHTVRTWLMHPRRSVETTFTSHSSPQFLCAS
ncbi:hypothetical protein VTN00DRAFT_4728 [Thermoascus crustaceus]|uniref:uncharacterized protein n=1 Tax=Thermoascus crustaceus TaxID=5088 RepID=UPI0037439BB4